MDLYLPTGPETLFTVPVLWVSISATVGAHDKVGCCPSVSAGGWFWASPPLP